MQQIILKANMDKCEIFNWSLNTEEVNARTLTVEMSKELTDCDKQFVTFELEDTTIYESPVKDNTAYIPTIHKPQTLKIGLYTADFENGACMKRYSPRPVSVYVPKGSYSGNAVPTEVTYAQLLMEIEKANKPITTDRIADGAVTIDKVPLYFGKDLFNFNTSPDIKLVATQMKPSKQVSVAAELANKVTQINKESTDEQIPTAKSVYSGLEKFKETELDYTRVYAYDAAQLQSKPELKGHKAFRTESYITNHTQGNTILNKSIWYFFELAIAKKFAGEELTILLESPLDVGYSERYKHIEFATEGIIDCGINSGKYNTFFVEELNKDFVDGETVLGVNLSCDDYTETDISGDAIGYLRCHLQIDVADVEYEGVPLAAILKQEFDQMLGELDTIVFAIKFVNTPEIETVKAQYIGGN